MQRGMLKDKDYDLISVVYHASQACATCEQYASDAERQGDEEAAKFFNQVHERNAAIIEQGKTLLKSRV